MGEKRISHTFGVVGGDERQVYLARAIAEDGYPVLTGALEKGTGVPGPAGLGELLHRADVIIFPLPATRDGVLLNAPLAAEPLTLEEDFVRRLAGKQVLGGMTRKLRETTAGWSRVDLMDYYEREELLIGNAVLTAEGAIGAAIAGHPGALNGGRCLVTGFGRIGKALCLGLKGLGAHVDCAARKAGDLMAIEALGCGAVRYGSIGGGYDVIFNTVPHLVLEARALSKQSPDCLLMELASAPGGIDGEAAARLGLKVQPEPSLPGRTSPKRAAELIKNTVYHMLEERGSW